jgi:hypothetical protein
VWKTTMVTTTMMSSTAIECVSKLIARWWAQLPGPSSQPDVPTLPAVCFSLSGGPPIRRWLRRSHGGFLF